jgi:hypothetical protein
MFEIRDKTGRRIHLSTERWKHIKTEHPEIAQPEDLFPVLTQPDVITASDRDERGRFSEFSILVYGVKASEAQLSNGDCQDFVSHEFPKCKRWIHTSRRNVVTNLIRRLIT